MEHHDRQHGPAVVLVVDEQAPAFRTCLHTAHEAVRPVVTRRDAIRSFEKYRQIHVRLIQGKTQFLCDRVPVAHEQAHDLGGLIITVERKFLSPYLRQIFARQHHVRATDQRREIAVECFDVHRGCADDVEKPGEAGKLVIGEWLEESQVCHGGLYGCARSKRAACNLLPKVRVVAGRPPATALDHANRLYDVETGKHRSEIDRIFVAKRVVPKEMDVLPGDGRDLFQHVERLLVAVALITFEQLREQH
ncbi:hypothetical protein R75465_08623 [Paraburkholderia aspalathi]|nr:hypothetical protein R75465_08623 [Paraburkholderia aspalathi]